MVALSGFFGSASLAQDDFRAGHLFWMPAGSTWLNRDKPRPFVMATPCPRGGRGTLVYGSTQETERRFGAACITVAPVRAGLSRNRLRARTFFYTGVLLPILHRYLPPHSGFLGKSVEQLREALRAALGIGCGSCKGPRAPAGSRRGRIVRLSESLRQDIRAPFAVVLTEPRYSREMHYHVILPILNDPRREPGRHDLIVCAGEWLSLFPDAAGHVLLPIPTTHSVWYPDDIAGETEYVLDDEPLREIDARLCSYFSL